MMSSPDVSYHISQSNVLYIYERQDYSYVNKCVRPTSVGVYFSIRVIMAAQIFALHI